MNETLVRSLSGAVYVFLLVFATLYSRESFLILFGLFLLQTVNEFSKLIRIDRFVSILVSVILYIIFVLFLNDNQYYIDNIIFSISFLTCLMLLYWLFKKENIESKSKLFKWFCLIGYIAFAFLLLTKLVFITYHNENDYLSTRLTNYLPQFLIGIFILIWTNDSFAYLTGKSFGKNKLFERISPKKTIEGFAGGMLFAMLASILISLFYVSELEIWKWIVIALIVSFFGTLGDLIQSKFKRIAGVKDSGNIMPGHGGIYDRLDSIIFVIPFVYLFLKIIGNVS